MDRIVKCLKVQIQQPVYSHLARAFHENTFDNHILLSYNPFSADVARINFGNHVVFECYTTGDMSISSS